MYEITTARSFQGPRRRRAGIEVARGQVIEAELSKEQLDEIKADPMLEVKAIKAEKKKAVAKDRQMVDKQEGKEA